MIRVHCGICSEDVLFWSLPLEQRPGPLMSRLPAKNVLKSSLLDAQVVGRVSLRTHEEPG